MKIVYVFNPKGTRPEVPMPELLARLVTRYVPRYDWWPERQEIIK